MIADLFQWFSTGEDFVPPGNVWQCLKMFLVATGEVVLLVAAREEGCS